MEQMNAGVVAEICRKRHQTGTVREVNEMSRYIDAERIKLLMKQDRLLQGNCEYELWKQEVDRQVNALPYIDLDDYVPREFHDKTCEEMAKRHQEEIADMVSVVRCKECRWAKPNKEGDYDCKCHIPIFRVSADGFCSYGCRSEKPNNCEHITEDGVTCARYPACDDCPDNPLNKVKGSERLVKGSEVTTDCRQLERSRR